VRFRSLDAMAQQEAPRPIDEASGAGLARLLERHEIKALRRRCSGDHFVRYLWDGRIFLINRSGSVHIAAARFMAGQLEQRVELGGELQLLSIEPSAVNSLRHDFELFAVSARDAFASIAFHEALRNSRTPYLSKRMPSPHADTEVIFLPRDDQRSMAMAAELRAAGFPDVGKHLSMLVLRQHMNAACHGDNQEALAA
jgi:rhodanese-related sulfurtransferase